MKKFISAGLVFVMVGGLQVSAQSSVEILPRATTPADPLNLEDLQGGFDLAPRPQQQQPTSVPSAGPKPTAGYPREWSNELYNGFLKASAAKSPLIVMFTQSPCGWCVVLATTIDADPRLRPLHAKAVLVAVDPARDEDDKGNVLQLQKDLKVTKFPTVVVLDVAPNGMRERGRIVGAFPANEFLSNLAQLLPPDAARVISAK